MQADVFVKLIDQSKEFWLDVIKKWIYKTNTVTVIAKPSEEMMRKISEDNKRRVSERKTKLGKKGLLELERALENAVDQNDVIN